MNRVVNSSELHLLLVLGLCKKKNPKCSLRIAALQQLPGLHTP